MNSDRPVAVIGAGGPTGRPILAKLAEEGMKIRVIRRSTTGSAPGDGPETAQADLADADALAEALRGCSQVYYIPPGLDDREEIYARNLLAAMQSAGIARVTYHSVLHAATPDLPHHARKSRVEHIFRTSTATWTVLQPAMYMQSSLLFFDSAAGRLAPAHDVRSVFSPIDLQDLAAAVAVVLGQSGHEFATYELAGSERLSYEDMAAQLSRVLDREIRAERGDRAATLSAIQKAVGFSDHAMTEFGIMLDHYEHHGLVGNGNVLGWLLGRSPTTYRAMLERTVG